MVFWTFTKLFETVKNILHIVDYVMIKKGVKDFILGTSSLFGKGDYVHTIKKLRVL